MVRRRIVTISIVALHVLVATWAIGVLKPDTFRYGEYGDSITLMLVFDRGQLRMTCWLASDPPAATGDGGFERYGFGYRAEINITPTNKVNRMYRVMMPMWSLLAVCMFYPTLAFIRGPVTRLRRRRLNRCAPCGYSLIGNISGVCPECGSIVPRRANDGSFERPTCAIEARLWRWFEGLTSRKGGLTLVVLVFLAIGIDVLLDRPWESATTRAYRLCLADGLSREQIDTSILGFRGGFSPGSQLYARLANLFPSGTSRGSQKCQAAMREAASTLPRPAPPRMLLPPPKAE